MGVFKSQFTRALNVIPSANCNIPYPNAIVSSTTTDASPNSLIDSSVDFIALNVQSGDIVYNTTSNQAATVAGVASATILDLNADIMANGDDYTIYQASSQTGLGNTGAFLLLSAAGNVVITTIGGDELTVGASAGLLPIQVLKLTSTSEGVTATALW
jgi:hypothetical protein